MMYDYFRVTGAHDTVLDYADLFSVTLRDDNIQEFDTRWDGVLLSMSKIPSDDGKSTCYQWKEKGQCSKGDQCSFRHETIVRKNQNTMPPQLLS